MPEVIIEYKSEQALEALRDLAKVFDISIRTTPTSEVVLPANQQVALPITFAVNPNVSALAGIWEGRDISLKELRKEAWGNRY